MPATHNLLDALVRATAGAATHHPDDQLPPQTVLWPDKERQWEPLLGELRARLPLLTLGPYAPGERRGPAYYLRCMIDSALDDDQLPGDAVPIIYLPGVSRRELRAIEECPAALQPLAHLQYSGALWTHKNGRDWTVAAFLQSGIDGVSIEVAADAATRKALLRALPVLAHEPLERLRRESPLRAPFLNGLLNPDEVRRLLLWMNDPPSYRAAATSAEWTAFCELCKHRYSLQPAQDGELVAAERLGQATGAWAQVWQRYVEAPDAYPHLPDLLRRARPKPLPTFTVDRHWPQDNESAEDSLRSALLALAERPPADVRAAILALETEHGERRDWVWARLHLAPLAQALVPLVCLAEATQEALGGPDLETIAAAYVTWGWQADAAVLDALAAAEDEQDVAAVQAALLPLYRPWLEQGARVFQMKVLANAAQDYVVSPLEAPGPGTCILFCDALRYDVAGRLAERLMAGGLAVHTEWRLAALPTVTATAKPALLPVGESITGGPPGLAPVVKSSGTPVNAEQVRKLLRDADFQILTDDGTGNPQGHAWTESGAIDQYGHGHGWRLAIHVEGELRALEGRIAGLLAAGWQRVLVVTDHGWLLLPKGLPKAVLAEPLTLERKGRCAVLKDGADTDHATVPWYWDAETRIALAPGIACFEAGREYEHGGLSPQECVVPMLTVTAVSPSVEQAVRIVGVGWRGLRCYVELEGNLAGVHVDIRTKAANASTSLVTPKAPGEDGVLSLPVPDDDRSGDAVFVVVCAEDGTLLAQELTTVGG